MGYQPNVVSKGDVVEINGALFVAKNDFNRLKGGSKLKLEYFGDVVTREYHKGVVRKNG